MKKSDDIGKIYTDFYKTYQKYIPEFYKDFSRFKNQDIFPLISYMKIYTNDNSIVKLMRNVFLDLDTGWIIIIENKLGIRRSSWFYVQYFVNKRLGKRYILGLKQNKKTILCAIATHVSEIVSEQKRSVTKKALIKAKNIIREKLQKEKDYFVFNQHKIDQKVFFFAKKKKIRRFSPPWLRIYQFAKLIKMYWKGNQ